MAPSITVQLPSFATYGSWLSDDWTRLLDLASAAEDAGIDRVAMVDHVVMGRDMSQYHWAEVSMPSDLPWLEPLSILGAIAGRTSTLRLTTRILVAPLRPATLLAKTAATLDVLSNGRLDLGVGTGWQREEYEAQGLDFSQRGQMLSDTIAACRVLWRDLPAEFRSATVSFEDIFAAPTPTQQRLPVWFGGTLHRRNLERIARHGDGWIPIMQAGLDAVRTGAATLRDTITDRQIDVQGELPIIQVDGAPDVAATLAQAPEFIEAGATDIFVSLASICPDAGGAFDALAALGQRFETVRGA